MKVSDVMSRDVKAASPTDKVEAVARLMSEIDSGVIPIKDGDELVGVITDRDLVIRVLAENRDAEIEVGEVMTSPVETCSASDSVKDVTKRMADLQMRRLLVVDDEDKIIGIVSLGDIAREASAKAVGHTLEEISEG